MMSPFARLMAKGLRSYRTNLGASFFFFPALHQPGHVRLGRSAPTLGQTDLPAPALLARAPPHLRRVLTAPRCRNVPEAATYALRLSAGSGTRAPQQLGIDAVFFVHGAEFVDPLIQRADAGDELPEQLLADVVYWWMISAEHRGQACGR